MAVIKVNDSNFQETLESITTPVLLKFGTSECSPCKSLSTALQNLPAVQEDRVTVLEIDMEESPDTTMNLRITSAPTLLLFIENKQKDKQVGGQSESALKKLLQKHNIA